jgi:GAF domain-containing protein
MCFLGGDRLPEDLKAQALETFNLYHKTVLQSYIQAREDSVMGQVESLLQETIALQQLSQALSGAPNFDDILDIFYQTCTKVLGFDFVVFSLVDPKQQRIQAIGGIGVSKDHLENANQPLDGKDIMADIIRTGKTEIITGWDSRFDKKIFKEEGMDEWGLRVFTPITLRRENIGLVEVGFNQHTETSVDESQIRLLRTFIDQTALALENAKREEASQQAIHREALIKDITTKVRASTNLDTVLQTTVKEIGDALGGKRVYIHLVSSNNGQ